MNNALDIILKRRAEIEREMQEHRDRIQQLQAEIPDLAVAERVLIKLTEGQVEETVTLNAAQIEGAALLHAHLQKPVDIPTMPEMIMESLTAAQLLYQTGLEPKDILKYIADKWWPEVRSELVGPIAWRMWRRGDLEKDGPLYRLSRKNEPAGTPSESAPTGSEPGIFD